MSKHTPGPWRRWTASDGRWCVMGDDNSIVAEVLPWDESGCRQEDHANALLIANAPRMLETLKRIHHFATGDCEMDAATRLRCIAMEAMGTMLNASSVNQSNDYDAESLIHEFFNNQLTEE